MMGGRGAGAGRHGAASRWTDEDLGIGGIMDDADGTITDRQLQYIRDLQKKLQELADSGYTYGAPGAVPPSPVSDKWRQEAERRFPIDESAGFKAIDASIDAQEAFERQQLEAWRRDQPAKAKERSRRLRAINPERLSRGGASKFIDAV